MTKYGIDSTVIHQIINLANRHHIQTVILFGSRARGDFHRTSDIDLAVQGGNVWPHIFLYARVILVCLFDNFTRGTCLSGIDAFVSQQLF